MGPPAQAAAERLGVAYGEDLGAFEFGSVVVNSVGTGGAATKVSAARLAAASGIGTLVTSADLVDQALSGAPVGTWFEPNPAPAESTLTGVLHPLGHGAVRAAR